MADPRSKPLVVERWEQLKDLVQRAEALSINGCGNDTEPWSWTALLLVKEAVLEGTSGPASLAQAMAHRGEKVGRRIDSDDEVQFNNGLYNLARAVERWCERPKMGGADEVADFASALNQALKLFAALERVDR